MCSPPPRVTAGRTTTDDVAAMFPCLPCARRNCPWSAVSAVAAGATQDPVTAVASLLHMPDISSSMHVSPGTTAGTYELQFVPIASGDHVVQIYVGNRAIPPFTISVVEASGTFVPLASPLAVAAQTRGGSRPRSPRSTASSHCGRVTFVPVWALPHGRSELPAVPIHRGRSVYRSTSSVIVDATVVSPVFSAPTPAADVAPLTLPEPALAADATVPDEPVMPDLPPGAGVAAIDALFQDAFAETDMDFGGTDVAIATPTTMVTGAAEPSTSTAKTMRPWQSATDLPAFVAASRTGAVYGGEDGEDGPSPRNPQGRPTSAMSTAPSMASAWSLDGAAASIATGALVEPSPGPAAQPEAMATEATPGAVVLDHLLRESAFAELIHGLQRLAVERTPVQQTKVRCSDECSRDGATFAGRRGATG